MPNPPRSPPSPGPGPGPMPLPYSTFGYDSPPSIPPSLSSSDSSDSSSVSSSLGGDHSILPPPISSRVSSNQRFARLGPDSQGHEIPLDAKWTRIRRSLVSAEVLAREGLRYEARPDFVAILGELKREDISELAKKSQKVRNERQRIASSTSSGPTQAESNGSKWQLKAHDGGFGPTHETSEDTNPAAEPIATAFQEDAPDLETAKRDQRLSSAKVQVPEADEQVPLATTTDKYSNNVTKKTDESGIPDDWLDSTTSATSNPSFNYIKRAREVLVRFLLEDVELSDLMMDAAIDLNISVDRLARDFRRLLDSYSRALKQVAQGRSQREMAKFFQHSSAYVSSASEMGLAASEEDEISRHINAIEDDQRQAVRELLIKFLEDINSLEESQIAPLPADTALILGEGCDTYYNREINNALAEVKDFLKSGSPFERLREELRTFVQPLKNEEQQPINSSPHKVDVESPTLPEQHARQSDIATSTYIDRTDSQGFVSQRKDSSGGLCFFYATRRAEDPCNLRMCVRRHTIANDATEGFQSLPVLVDRIFDLLMPSWEPPVPKGKKRVRWICQCGTRLFDDFVELQPGMVENLEAELQQHASGSGFEAWKQVGKLLAIAIKTWITSRFMGERLGTSNITSTHLPLHNTNAQTNISSIPLNRGNLHLLLCVEKGDFETKLHQEIIDGYSNDKDMFRFLHKKYHHSYQKFKTWFTIRGISQLSLTRFKVDLGSFAEAHAHASICNPSCVCLPPKNRIGVEYRCDPAPETDPGYVPAIGSARLTHYFRNPECVNDRQTTIYTQLPKRIVGELLASETKEELGWGIHFQAGWHWRTIYVILVVFLFCFSLIFGIVWSISKTDIQGAFAISGFWLTSGGILLGYLAIRSP